MEIERIVTSDPEKRSWFEELVQKAYDNGWTYSSCTPELWNDYVVRWNHFIDYIDRLKLSDGLDVVKILIGEAPPFYRATKEDYERAYFYAPNETGSSPWFSAPLVHFVGKNQRGDKQSKLNALSTEGVLLIDIFPFPIIQDTEMRMDITGAFSAHLANYFVPLVQSVMNYIETKNGDDSTRVEFQWGITATKYAGTQLMLGENSRSILENGFEGFFESPITEDISNKRYLEFHDNKKKPFTSSKDSLSLSIWSNPKKKKKFRKKVFSPYFVFVVTLLHANQWIGYVKENKGKASFSAYTFTSELIRNNVNSFLTSMNERLKEKKMLPIFSTVSGGISFNEKAFFNSN